MLYPVRTFLTLRRDKSFYLYFNELFLVSKLALQLIVLGVDLFDSLYKSRSDILAFFVALH